MATTRAVIASSPKGGAETPRKPHIVQKRACGCCRCFPFPSPPLFSDAYVFFVGVTALEAVEGYSKWMGAQWHAKTKASPLSCSASRACTSSPSSHHSASLPPAVEAEDPKEAAVKTPILPKDRRACTKPTAALGKVR
ncbi:hypothetical protein OPV22_025693 [Ensete ventricosum]|uniref:RIN4 pathogenic type III effector avirulence factor Avr cleavage site domain-containing protein n=1 Tax=Ensete ventricosum TaxID=4639 RepID=A0AAV8QI44_ENSVE|nr:hypothetical protein OPV22_025693 [Ensete ventricosum]